jgi:hypothetical protein
MYRGEKSGTCIRVMEESDYWNPEPIKNIGQLYHTPPILKKTMHIIEETNIQK